MANFNLPGVYTFYKERGLMVAPAAPDSVTDEILLIGTAHDGPKNIPTRIERPEDAFNLFGNPGRLDNKHAGSLLVPAFCEAYYAGARNIYLMRITGEEAKLEGVGGLFDLYAPYPGEKYNGIMVAVDNKKIYIWNKDNIGIDSWEDLLDNADEDQYEVFDAANTNKYKTVGDLAEDIVARANLRVVIRDDVDVNAQPGELIGDFENAQFEGGEDGTDVSPSEYKEALAEAYELIVDYNVKIVVPLGVYVGMTDDTTPVYDRTDADILANFCYTAAKRNNDVIGIISVKPFGGNSLSEVNTKIKALVNNANNEIIAEDGIDIGKYVSIVIGEGLFSDRRLGEYTNTIAAAYAGLVSTLPIQSGSTNKVISGISSLLYDISPAQASELRDKRFTVIRNKFNRGITVVEGIVCSLPTSDFQSLSTVRVVHGVMDAIREIVDPFIGESLDIPHVTSLQNAIEGRLNRFVEEGAITAASFQILFPQNAAILGDVHVELELGIASELRRILVTVSRSISDLNNRFRYKF
jgi:hypothetical protein